MRFGTSWPAGGGRREYVSMGCGGWLLAAPFIFIGYTLWLAVMILVWLAKGLWLACLWARERWQRSGR